MAIALIIYLYLNANSVLNFFHSDSPDLSNLSLFGKQMFT